MRAFVLCFMFLACILSICLCIVAAQQSTAIDAPSQRRLVYVEETNIAEISANCRDVLQIRPFSFPILPKFVGAKISYTLKGDRILEHIGMTTSETRLDGIASLNLFLYARLKGECEIMLRLVDENDEEIPGYQASYVVKIK